MKYFYQIDKRILRLGFKILYRGINCSMKRKEKPINEYPDMAEVQMDSVIGTRGECLLTIHFVESSLMLAFLRDVIPPSL